MRIHLKIFKKDVVLYKKLVYFCSLNLFHIDIKYCLVYRCLYYFLTKKINYENKIFINCLNGFRGVDVVM